MVFTHFTHRRVESRDMYTVNKTIKENAMSKISRSELEDLGDSGNDYLDDDSERSFGKAGIEKFQRNPKFRREERDRRGRKHVERDDGKPLH